MRRGEIRAGVVYGVRQSFGGLSPVVFLEDGAAHVWQDNEFGDLAYERTDRRPGKDSLYGDRGYAVLVPDRGILGSGYDALAALREVDPAAELARFEARARRHGDVDDDGPSSPSLRFGVLMTLGLVIGPFDEADAEHQAQRERRAAERDDADQRSKEQGVRASVIVAELATLGIQATSTWDYGRHVIQLGLDEADSLILMFRQPDARSSGRLGWRQVERILAGAGYQWAPGRDDGEGFAVAQVTGDTVDVSHMTQLTGDARRVRVHTMLAGYRKALQDAGLTAGQASALQDYLVVTAAPEP
jgi:hypothetical protein